MGRELSNQLVSLSNPPFKYSETFPKHSTYYCLFNFLIYENQLIAGDLVIFELLLASPNDVDHILCGEPLPELDISGSCLLLSTIHIMIVCPCPLLPHRQIFKSQKGDLPSFHHAQPKAHILQTSVQSN